MLTGNGYFEKWNWTWINLLDFLEKSEWLGIPKYFDTYLSFVANRVSYFLNSKNTGIMTSLQGFPCMPLVHFCRCSLNHFDPVLRPLLYGQFLTVRCELYQICAKKSWSEFNQILCRHSIAPKLAKCLQFEVYQQWGLLCSKADTVVLP